MNEFNWTCPHCSHHVTITESHYDDSRNILDIENADGPHVLKTRFIVCPNPACRKFTLTVALFEAAPGEPGHMTMGAPLLVKRLVPPSSARVCPDYVPQAIRQDYEEACLIRDLSPKASATLARRCLQGMLRDFWDVKPGRLVDEIEHIKDKTESSTWRAIESVRKVGNIGAHMKEDTNVIVDVGPREAELLISLIETLLQDW